MEFSSLDFNVGQNVSNETVLRNVALNSRRKIGWVIPLKAHDGIAAIVGGGSSISGMMPIIEAISSMGANIFSLNGAAKYLMSNGVISHHLVMIDGRPENASFVESNPAHHYFLASQCDSLVFDAVSSDNITGFHCGGVDLSSALTKGDLVTQINGGITVGLTAIALAFTLGFRIIHVFGLDSSEGPSSLYAYPQEENRLESERVDIRCGDRWFKTSYCMAKQAERFPALAASIAEHDGTIIVHGDGLLPYVAQQMMISPAIAA